MRKFIRKTWVIADFEIRKILHDPTEVLMRAVQPALWLLIFGQVMARTRMIPGENYLDFMSPGILAQSVLFVSIFYGIAIIWERDLGLTHKFLATPTPRTALVLGKALSAGIRCIPLMIIIYILAALLSVHVLWNPVNIIGVIFLLLLGAILFSTFSLIIACLEKTRERFMGIGQLMTMPRSEEHTSELQSPCNLVCLLLLEKKERDVDRHVLVVGQGKGVVHGHSPWPLLKDSSCRHLAAPMSTSSATAQFFF